MPLCRLTTSLGKRASPADGTAFLTALRASTFATMDVGVGRVGRVGRVGFILISNLVGRKRRLSRRRPHV